MGANRLTAGGTYMYVTQGWTSIPSRGGGGGVAVEILLVASCYGNWNKLWPDGLLRLYADLTLTLPFFWSILKIASSTLMLKRQLLLF